MKKFDYKSDHEKFKPKNKVKITFMDKLILFLCVSWFVIPLAILTMLGVLANLTSTSLSDLFRILKDLSIPFIFFFLLNFPNKSYKTYQKTICWIMIILDVLALFGIYYIGSHF